MHFDDSPKDECGVFGIFGHPKAVELTYLGLRALQHRGQESSGIVSSDGERLSFHHGMGLVDAVFSQDILSQLTGHIAIGHNRYSTAGSSTLENAQPLVRNYKEGQLALGHNGNLVNAIPIRNHLEKAGSIFSTSLDTEVIFHLIAHSRQRSLEDRIFDAFRAVEGAYSFVVMDRETLMGARDPSGFRPLWIGRLGEAFILSSETCALDVIEAEPIREVEPGELVTFRSIHQGIESYRFLPKKTNLSQCIFEYIYLARPDGNMFGQGVNSTRREFGRQLAREHPVKGDVVIPVPDSATIAALGYAEESGIPFDLGLSRNPFVGRTFMNPTQDIRELMVKVKLNPIREVLDGRRVIMVDDSIMRGTNSRKLVKIVREGGATAVHLRIASPPNKYPCFYGVDTPTRSELIASEHTIEEIRKYIRADSLGYVSIEGMLNSVKSPDNFCTACFDGEYPVPLHEGVPRQLPLISTY
ncbi:amidophosphoribosyltransferase [Candidatus Poribacteria bacterium]|nr:MAG: amidophosphoribosyltransferase [Candidatus Poribacteria bacterium]